VILVSALVVVMVTLAACGHSGGGRRGGDRRGLRRWRSRRRSSGTGSYHQIDGLRRQRALRRVDGVGGGGREGGGGGGGGEHGIAGGDGMTVVFHQVLQVAFRQVAARLAQVQLRLLLEQESSLKKNSKLSCFFGA
jgi:hypothetical protein